MSSWHVAATAACWPRCLPSPMRTPGANDCRASGCCACTELGDKPDALAAGHELRRRLVDELGLDPGPELLELERSILEHAGDLRPVDATGPRPTLAPLLQAAHTNALVGRQSEREWLRRLWQSAIEGERQVALVAGEAGIGKTRLIAELAAEADADGALVAYGHCDEELEAPYRPWVDVVRALVPFLPPEEIAGHRARWANVLARVVPGLGPIPVVEGDPETERLRLFDAVADLVQLVAARVPLLVILDDLHWADRSSLLLLRHLVRSPSERRWLLAATYRDTDVAGNDPLAGTLADLRRTAGIERVTLGGLDVDSIGELLTTRGGGSLGEARARQWAYRLETETAGNPFFIGEVVRHLADSGALSDVPVGDTDRWMPSDLALPEGVREVIARRLASLPEAVLQILVGAAATGSEFDAGVVAEVLGRPIDAAVDGLDAALGRRLVVEVPGRFGRYRFVHALVRQALEEQLSRTRRVRLHHRIAQVLEATGAPTVELARHFAAAAPEGDADKAVLWCRRAATDALDALAYDEAVTYCQMALAALDLGGSGATEAHVDLLMVLASTANRAGDDAAWRGAALEAARIAHHLGDPEVVARAALSLMGTLGPTSVVDEEVVSAMTDAAGLLRAAEPEAGHQAMLAELLARLGAYLVTDRPLEAEALTEEALSVARHAADTRSLAIALVYSTHTYRLGRAERQDRLREAAELANDCGDPEVVMSASTALMIDGLLWANRAQFDRGLLEYDRVASELGAATPLLLSAINHAGALALDGRYIEADRKLDETRARAASLGDPSHMEAILAAVDPVQRELGRLEPIVEASRPTIIASPNIVYHVWFVRALAETAQLEEARQRLHGLLEHPESFRTGFLRRHMLGLLAEAAAVLEDADVAAQLDRWLEEELDHGICINVGAHAFAGAVSAFAGTDGARARTPRRRRRPPRVGPRGA